MDDTVLRLQNDLAAARFEMNQALRAAKDADAAAADISDAALAKDLREMAVAFRAEAAALKGVVTLLEERLRAVGVL